MVNSKSKRKSKSANAVRQNDTKTRRRVERCVQKKCNVPSASESVIVLFRCRIQFQVTLCSEGVA
ncbi:hypothetical protein Hdeb2414_s0060g00762051 [Helianthus debilis subsp. tardiflorus]